MTGRVYFYMEAIEECGMGASIESIVSAVRPLGPSGDFPLILRCSSGVMRLLLLQEKNNSVDECLG